MSDSHHLLERIEQFVVEHGGDLGGWTRLTDDTLQVFDGRMSLRVELENQEPMAGSIVVHAHVLMTLHDHDDTVLDACVFGFGPDQETAMGQAARVWLTSVAGPVRSFLDDKPICMTSRAGEVSEEGTEGDYGLPGLRAFVGPAISRKFGDGLDLVSFDGSMPWFQFAPESASPRTVHLAKATINAKGKDGWKRELEIDGHDVTHHNLDWPTTETGPDFGYMTRFAVFEFPGDSTEIAHRIELERTIRHFALNFAQVESVDQLMEAMIGQGFDPDLTHEAESIATIAFGRNLFEPAGVKYASTIIRARRDGRVEVDVPLASLPAYSRGQSLAGSLRETMSPENFQRLCLYNAESNAILNAMDALGAKVDLSQLKMWPSIVPERGVSDSTMATAMATAEAIRAQNRPNAKKPWWKFW